MCELGFFFFFFGRVGAKSLYIFRRHVTHISILYVASQSQHNTCIVSRFFFGTLFLLSFLLLPMYTVHVIKVQPHAATRSHKAMREHAHTQKTAQNSIHVGGPHLLLTIINRGFDVGLKAFSTAIAARSIARLLTVAVITVETRNNAQLARGSSHIL